MKTTQAEELLRTRPMTPEVLAISKLQIVGDVVPNNWDKITELDTRNAEEAE